MAVFYALYGLTEESVTEGVAKLTEGVAPSDALGIACL